MLQILTSDKHFLENYKPIRLGLELIYKITKNKCRLQLFAEFIQTQRRYPTSHYKINIQLEDYSSYQANIFLVN